ncbi:MAG: hypothetical protein PWQ06_2052 [Anaerophaga sp.]|nr:hypothetical protein [Anaerophaga sp.]
MAENVLLKARVAKIEFADPIASAADLDLASWEQQPLTLRDDEVTISEEDPEESEVFSHENDSAEDYDIVGSGLTASGSFIKATYDQLVELVGGTKEGTDPDYKFHKSARKLLLHKAIRFTLKSGGEIIIPNAKGYVNTNLSLGYGGVSKFPFRFKALVAAPDWDVDIIW